jgi:basic amino acid/polyamine antiporter, APA family
MSQPATTPSVGLAKALTLTDAVLLLVGGVIGSGIFLTAGQIAVSVKRVDAFILIWVAGGLISLLACLSVAELGGMFPTSGSQFVFLREAYGELPAFLYGWITVAAGQTGAAAAIAVGFATYLGSLVPAVAPYTKAVAISAIALVTVINIFGVKQGSVLVNIATWTKYAGMAALVVFGFALGKGSTAHFSQQLPDAPAGSQLAMAFGLAMISVLFAYEGWSYVTWVAGEMKNGARDVPKALIIGISAVIVIYLLMNAVYVYALPLSAISQSKAIVREAGAALFSPRVGAALAAMVLVSTFGALSSAILATARLAYAMARDGVLFPALAYVHPRYQTPVTSLVALAAWAAAIALSGTFGQLLTFSVFMMILGYIASVGALFVLRRKLPDHPRPYRCIGYPFVPVLYLLVAGAWVINTVVTSPRESMSGVVIAVLGIPGYLFWTRKRRAA